MARGRCSICDKVQDLSSYFPNVCIGCKPVKRTLRPFVSRPIPKIINSIKRRDRRQSIEDSHTSEDRYRARMREFMKNYKNI